MTLPDPRDHALDILLEEKLGGIRPPDLVADILAAAGRRGPPAAEDLSSNDPHPFGEDDQMNTDRSDFEHLTVGANHGLLGDFVGFMAENKKWWMIPFAVVFGLLGALLVLGATGAAPFIYALF